MKQNKTILVVEDNQLLRQAICEFIHYFRPTWHIAEAANGQEGIQLATAVQFDLIVTDLRMPVMDGFEMVTALQKRADTCTIPVVLATSEDMSCPCVTRLRTHCHTVIFKPFLFSQLEQTLEAILPLHAESDYNLLSCRGARQTRLPGVIMAKPLVSNLAAPTAHYA